MLLVRGADFRRIGTALAMLSLAAVTIASDRHGARARETGAVGGVGVEVIAVGAAGVPPGVTERISPVGESWIDPEILHLDTGEGLIAWQDGWSGTVWAARIDPHTGLPDGAARWQMGAGAAPVLSTNNGPEFGVDEHGWSLYYSLGASGTQVGRSQLQGATPVLSVLTHGDEHFTPMATKNATAPSTRLLVLRRPPAWGTAAWMDVAAPEQLHDITYLSTRSDGDLRWIDGTFTLVADCHPAHPGRLALIDTVTGEVTPVSDEPRRTTNPYGWHAPEAGGGLLVLGVVDDTELVAWSKVEGAWRPFLRWTPPAGAPRYIGSPEPFVAGSRSYVSLSLADSPETVPGVTDQQIWVVGVAPDRPFTVRCDDARPAPVTRVDPEVFVGAEQAFVYYYELGDGESVAYRCALGIDTARPALRAVLASQTDPAIDDLLGAHVVAVGPADARIGRLLVFYPGTGATADRYTLFLTRAAELGYHAIGLAYDNRDAVNWDICPGQPDSCYEDVRLEILMGVESGYTPPAVDADNSAFNRLTRLLSYLHDSYPDEGWDAYLTAQGPRWDRIAFAGHSQGGGHAAMTAKLHKVARALLFSATEPKAWTSEPFETSSDRLYGFVHELEPSFDPIARSWANMGLPGLLTRVDATPPPFGGSHRLTTTTDACRGDVEDRGYHHNCPVVDDYTPLDPDGTPSLQGVWDAMLAPGEVTTAPRPPRRRLSHAAP